MVLIGGEHNTNCYQIDSTNCTIDGVKYSEREFNQILNKLAK